MTTGPRRRAVATARSTRTHRTSGRESLCRQRTAPLFPHVLEPRPRATLLSEQFADSQLGCDAGEDRMIVQRLSRWIENAAHGDYQGLAISEADILAFERGAGRQYDIRQFRVRVPDLFVHHDRFRSLPRPQKAVQILMMMERVAASPIHQPDVWIAQASAIEVEFRTRALEHVGDARHRDEHLEWVGRRREAWTGPDEWMRAPESIFAGVADAETAAGEANLADDRCQRNHCPERLLAVIGALQRPCRIHHRALAAISRAMSRASDLSRAGSTFAIWPAQSASLTIPSSLPRRYRSQRP